MVLEITSEQRDLLLQLVNQALDEIGPEIRHTFTRTYRDQLKHERTELLHLRDMLASLMLHNAEGVTAA
jgi:truncated hemoglobin YjbI